MLINRYLVEISGNQTRNIIVVTAVKSELRREPDQMLSLAGFDRAVLIEKVKQLS